MKIFLSGIMQGSLKGVGIQEQGYRQVIAEAIKSSHPDDEIIDPFLLFPDSVTFDDKKAKKTLFEIVDLAADADLIVAYLPEASMGSAMEMLRAYDQGKTILTITTLKKNWFILAVSAKLFHSLDEFCDWVQDANLEEWTSKPKQAV